MAVVIAAWLIVLLVTAGGALSDSSVVTATNENLTVTLGGRIHRMIQVVDDGLDFYAGVRRYKVERPDADLKPLLVAPLGVVLSF